MENNYLYIENNTWNWFDGVYSGIATIKQDRVSDYCLERADEIRNFNLGNYDELSKGERERLAHLWETAKDLSEGKYDYYFNLEDKREVFIQSVKTLATKLNIKYELILRED